MNTQPNHSNQDGKKVNIDEGARMLAAMPLEMQREMIEWLLERAAELGCVLDDDAPTTAVEPVAVDNPEHQPHADQQAIDDAFAALLADLDL